MPNADIKRQRCQLSEQLLEFFRHDPNDFLSWLVTMEKTWLYHYDPDTKQQSLEWQHSGSTCPKKFWVQKIRWISSCLNFLGSRRNHPHCLYSKGPNYQCGVLLISAGAMEGHFEGKMPQEGHQGGLVLEWQCPGSPGTCNPEETGLPGLPMSWSPTPFSGYGTVGTTNCSLDWKNNWKVAIFRPTRKSLLPWRPGCTDNLLIFFFFDWLAKVTAMG